MIVQVGVVQHSSVRQISIENLGDGGSDALNRRVTDGLFVVLDLPAAAHDGTYVLTMSAGIGNGLELVQFKVFAFFRCQKFIDVGLYRRHLAGDEHVGAEIKDFLGDVVLNTRDKGYNRDDRGNADDHSQ